MSAGAEVYAAFARVAEAVRGSVFGFLVPDEVFKECEVALANGLSRKQALNVRSYLDSEEERARARMALRVVASDQDAVTLLSWLASEMEAAMKADDGHEEAPAGTKTEGPTDGTDGTEGTEGTHATHGGAVLRSVRWRNFPMVELAYSGTQNWPHDGSVQAMIKVNGKKVEWLHPGQTVQSLKNIFGQEYRQEIHSGETAMLSIANIHGKNDSNALPLVWP